MIKRVIVFPMFITCVMFSLSSAVELDEQRKKEGLAVIASLLSGLEVCARKHPELHSAASNPLHFLSMSTSELEYTKTIMNLPEYPNVYNEWLLSAERLPSAQLESECRAFLDDLHKKR
jgi:hypothetical protein